MIRYSKPSTFVSLPEYFPKRMRSPTLTSRATSLPSSSRLPWPTAITSPSCGFSLAESGMMMPLRVVSCSSIRFTTMRSYKGRIFMMMLVSNYRLVSLKGEAFLNMTRVGRDAHIGHPQERVRRHAVNLQAIAFPQFGVRDEALQCRVRPVLAIEAKGGGPDLAGHVKERPSGRRDFLFELVAIELVRYRRPATRMQRGFEPQGLRKKRTLFDQNRSCCDHSNGLCSRTEVRFHHRGQVHSQLKLAIPRA